MVKPSSASALWSSICPTNKRKKDRHGKRLVVMDNYHTRHFLAEQTKSFSNGEIRILGTVKLLNIDGSSKATIETAKGDKATIETAKGDKVTIETAKAEIKDAKKGL